MSVLFRWFALKLANHLRPRRTQPQPSKAITSTTMSVPFRFGIELESLDMLRNSQGMNNATGVEKMYRVLADAGVEHTYSLVRKLSSGENDYEEWKVQPEDLPNDLRFPSGKCISNL
jgi:hypothetical protein